MNKKEKKSAAIGVDLGGTNLRVGIVDEEGNILKNLRRPTLAKEGKEKVIGRIVDCLEEAIAFSHELSKEIQGICIGAPGFIQLDKGVIRESPNLPGWKDVALAKEIMERGNFPPLFLQNDANSYTYGEWWKGAGKGFKSIIGITLGTGVGGGLVLNRQIWSGEDGMAGEIGHMTVEPSGLVCQCGRKGCLESYSSGTGIVKRTLAALKKGRDSSLTERISGNTASLTPKMVFEEATAGDQLSLEMLREGGRYLGIAVATLINILNIHRFVIGGGVAAASDIILGPAREEVQKRAIQTGTKREVIVQASLGDDAGIIGNAGIALKKGAGSATC